MKENTLNVSIVLSVEWFSMLNVLSVQHNVTQWTWRWRYLWRRRWQWFCYCHAECSRIVCYRRTSASVRSLRCCSRCCSATCPTTVGRVSSTSKSCTSMFRWSADYWTWLLIIDYCTTLMLTCWMHSHFIQLVTIVLFAYVCIFCHICRLTECFCKCIMS